MRWLGSVIFGLSIASVFSASASKSILVSSESVSWISTDNLTALLQASFDTSICCNVLMTDDSPAIRNVFNKFVKVYPYSFTLNNRKNNCQEYLLISISVDSLTTVMKTVPTAITSIQLLIVVISENVEESSGLFNVSMYQDVSVKIASPNGLWTLSENTLHPRVFKMVYRFHEMVHKRKLMDFQGRELQAVTVFDSPYNFLRPSINRTHNGTAAEIYSADNQSELDGIEVQLFLLMAKRLNFTWTIREGDRINRYGKRNGSGWSGGMVGQIYRKEVDIAFASIFLVLQRYEVTNMTQPWGRLLSTFAVPKAKPHRSFFALTTPLSKNVWVAVLIVLVVQSIYVWGRAWIDPRISRRFRNFILTFTELMGQMLGVWMPAKMQGLRLHLYLWHLAGILLVTAYSSNLAARLARDLYEDKINTMRDLAESNLTWGSQDKVTFEYLFDLTNPHDIAFRNRFEDEMGEAETREKIQKGNYAILGYILDTVFLPRNEVNDEDFKNYRIMDESVSTHYVGFSVQPWLVNPLNKMIVHLRESGLVQYHINSVLHRQLGPAQRELMIENIDADQGPKVLQLTSLGIGFCVLLLGLSISTIVFFLELKYFNKELSPLEVLRQIKRNREAWRIKELRRKRRYPFFGKFKEQNSSFIPQ